MKAITAKDAGFGILLLAMAVASIIVIQKVREARAEDTGAVQTSP